MRATRIVTCLLLLCGLALPATADAAAEDCINACGAKYQNTNKVMESVACLNPCLETFAREMRAAEGLLGADRVQCGLACIQRMRDGLAVCSGMGNTVNGGLCMETKANSFEHCIDECGFQE